MPNPLQVRERFPDGVPAGWQVDRDYWLRRSTRQADRARIQRASFIHRMFLGESGVTFCAERDEALYLDGAKNG